MGLLTEALAAAKCFNEGIKAKLGLDIKPIKRMTYSPSPVVRADLRRRNVPLGVVRADGSWIRVNDDDYAVPPDDAGYGIMVMGVPVGDEAFVAAVMAKKVRGTVSKINSTFESLRNSHKQTLHCIAYYCLNSLFDHWLQGLLPQHSVAHARLVDDALDAVLRHTLVPGALDDPLTLRRLRMPARHGGIGFRACADTGTEFAVKRLAGFIGRSTRLSYACSMSPPRMVSSLLATLMALLRSLDPAPLMKRKVIGMRT